MIEAHCCETWLVVSGEKLHQQSRADTLNHCDSDGQNQQNKGTDKLTESKAFIVTTLISLADRACPQRTVQNYLRERTDVETASESRDNKSKLSTLILLLS